MFTIIAYSESQDPGGAFVKIAGVPDQHVKVQGDGIYIPDFNHIIGAIAAAGTTGVEVRLVSPSLRRTNPLYITPILLALYPDSPNCHSVDPNNAIPLDINEALECEILSDPAAAEQNTVIVVLAPGALTPIAGQMITVNAEVTLALLAGAWNFAEIDFIDELPIGDYAVVGMRIIASTAVAARLVPVGASQRPGCPNSSDVEIDSGMVFRHGNLGEWFRFSTIQPPGIEVIGSAAVGSATYQLYLDLMKV